MCLISFAAKLVITIINTVFVIVSLLLIGFGFLLRHGADSGFVADLQNSVLKSISDGSSTLGLGTVDTSQFDLTEITGGLGLAMIILGFFFLTVSAFGFIGGCCESKFFLQIYIIIILVLIVAQVIGFILLMERSAIEGDIKTQLKKTITDDYKGLTGQNLQSLAWNFFMQQFKCCGVDNYADFNSSTQWNNTMHTVGSTTVYIDFPLACCITLPTTFSQAGVACASITSTLNYKSVSCFNEVYNQVLGDTTMVVLVFLAAIGVQIVLILFAYLIIRDKGQVSPV